MLKIRLQRVGRKNDPSFRVVVLESTQGPKAGKHVDQIGFYNAVTKQKTLDTTKATYWMSKGAQPSETVYNMLVTAGAIAGKKKNALPKKSPIKKDTPEVVSASNQTPVSEVAPVAEVVETPESTPESTPETAPEAPVEAAPEAVVEETPAA